MSQRPYHHTLERNQEELAWWESFAEVERDFSWVQTPEIQRQIRGHYVRRILRLVPPQGRIAELGCGVGWLSLLLARMGAENVVGIDFSRAQIEMGRVEARRLGLEDKVKFMVAQPDELNDHKGRYDFVLMHAFLHHLSVAEIEGALKTAHEILKSNGVLAIIEPVLYAEKADSNPRFLFRCLSFLQNLPSRGQTIGVRRISPGEQDVIDKLTRRSVGVPPFGVSPKEIPFEPEELPALLSKHFRLTNRKKVICSSHLAAQSLLLMQISYPVLGRALRWPLLFLVSRIERLVLRQAQPPAGMWIFEMFECKKK